MAISLSPRQPFRDWPWLLAFVPLYVLLDWISYTQPLFGLNITPWNPEPALGFVFWLRFGKRAALPWYAALLLSEMWIRGMPAGLPLSLLLSLQLVLGYGLIGQWLRHAFAAGDVLNERARLSFWLAAVAIGLMLNGTLYVTLLWLAGLVPAGMLAVAAVRYFIGDFVGVVVSMPLLYMLASKDGRHALAALLRTWETAGYLLLAALLVWGVFGGHIGGQEYKHFYFLFLPVIWAATRHGLTGTSLIAVALQSCLILMVRLTQPALVPFAELQLLAAALALVGLFIGVTVDEQRATAAGLKQSMRLAAAGEMAAALAHELNQPMTALAAYGKACEHLLERGDNGALLADSIGKMVREARRASEVVRRLREFFLTGAMHLELVPVEDIIEAVCAQFSQRCAEQGSVLKVRAEPGLMVRADRLQLELVLRNLVANGLDAVGIQGQGQGSVSVAAAARKGRLQVSVEDNGPGVSSAVAGRLFAPFVSGKSNGLGLGLALSRAIVEAHGGRLWAEMGGRGLFHFNLPLGQSGDDGAR